MGSIISAAGEKNVAAPAATHSGEMSYALAIETQATVGPFARDRSAGEAMSKHPPPSQPLIWRKEAGTALLVALVPLTIALAFRLGWPEFDLVEDDGLSLYQPLLTDSLRQLSAGRLPLWSDHTGCGFPLLARSFASYPPGWLAHGITRLLGPQWPEIAVLHLLHLALASFSAFLYLRVVGARRWPAEIGAVAYGLTGPFMGMATNWNDYCFWMAYVPFALLMIERLVAGSRSWFWPCLGGLVGSLVFEGGGPMGAFKFAVLAGLYYLLRCDWQHWPFSLSRLAVAAGLALLACGGPLFASWELLSRTSRVAADGLQQGEGLVVMACAPEYFRGFVYPLIEFDWKTGLEWSRHFYGATLFAGPLAPLAVCLAILGFRRSPGPQKALLILVVFYGLLSLGYYWDGNLLVQNLPLFRHNRWPVRWTLEFAGMAALLTGIALDTAWKQARRRQIRWAFGLFLLGACLAVTLRSAQFTTWELDWKALALPWLLTVGLLVYLFRRGRQTAFDVTAFTFTLLTLALNIPGAQQQRWSRLKQLYQAPLEIEVADSERILYLAERSGQRGPAGEGNLSYCLPHVFGDRTVLTYGPFALKMQEWQAGINTQGEIIDSEQAIRTFLGGHLLDTLRVGYVVVPRSDPALNEACRANPDLYHERDTKWKSIYRNHGFRQPAFFVKEVRGEGELSTPAALSQAPLSEVCFAESAYTGPSAYSAAGTVRNFREDNGRIGLETDSAADQFLVVTTTYFPGWKANVDGQGVPVYRVNGSFMAIPVPAGRHEVQLYYRPTLIVSLWALNLVVVIGLSGYCAGCVAVRLCAERRSINKHAAS